MAHGQITHIEFPADDLERARRFYSELFGWEFGAMEGFPDYFLFRAGTAEIGGAVGARGSAAPQRLRIYCEVDSIDAILARVEELGGAIAQAKSEIPGVGWYAAITDSEGNDLGLYESLPEG